MAIRTERPCACGCRAMASPGKRFAPDGHDNSLRRRIQELIDATAQPNVDAVFHNTHPAWESETRIMVTKTFGTYEVPYVGGLKPPTIGCLCTEQK